MKPRQKRLEDLPYELQGPSNNRFGGHKNSRLRGFKGSKYGAASKGTKFTQEQLEEYAAEHGEQISNRKLT